MRQQIARLFIGYNVGELPGLSRATAIALLIPQGGSTGSALTAKMIADQR